MVGEDYKLLSSIVVVRELYDADKSIYDVLDRLIAEIISRKKLYSFNSSQMTLLLNTECYMHDNLMKGKLVYF